MMGQQTGSETQLFYAFNLDEYVPEHHLLRRLDRFLDQQAWPTFSRFLQPHGTSVG